MAISYLQSRLTYGTGATVALAYSSNVAAGSLLVVIITQWRSGGITADSTVSDSQGNSYAKAGNRLGTPTGMSLEFWYAFAGSSGACTVTVDPQSNSTSVAIHEFSGITNTTPIDVQDQNTGNTSTPSGGPITTTNASDLLFAAVTTDAWGAANTETITPDADYTQMQEYEDGDSYSVVNTQYRIVSATLTDTANWTLFQNWNWAGWVVAFKAAPSGTNYAAGQPAYSAGRAAAAGTLPAYTAGTAAAASTLSAYAQGAAAATAALPAYALAVAAATATLPAYTAGTAALTATLPAFAQGAAATITRRAVGTLGVLAVGATSFTVPAPAGVQAGDLLLMFVSVHDTGAGNLGDAPADWTEVGGSTSSPGFGWFAWKRATASEPADYTIANVADSACAVVAAYYNVVSSGDPIHAWDVRGNASGAGGADAITTTVAGCMVVAAAAVYDNLRVSTWAVSDPATLTEWFDAGTNNGSDTGIAVADGLKSSTGSTGALSYSVAFATTGMLVALLPEGGGAAVTGTLPAYAAGVDTTTGVLTAYAAGSLTATGALPAFATGMGAATGVLPAYAQGQAGLAGTLPAYAQGQAGLVGTLPAYAAGVDTTAGTLPAYAAGVDTAAAALSAFAQGQASLSVTLPAFTAGVDTATGALAAFVQAADTAAVTLPAYAVGTAQHFDNLPAYAAGVDTAAGALPAYSAGGTAVTAGLPAFATGSGNVAAATLPAYSAGVATTDALQQAYARGSLETQAVLPAFALGAAAATAVLPAFAQGQAGLAAALPAFAQGADVAQAVLPAYAQGQAGLVDTLPAYAQGAASGVTASLPAYAAGLAAAAASQAAFTTGAAAAAGALPAYAAGQIAASLPAYAAGESATRQALFKGMFRGLRRGSA
jgi:hypothetical protein